ncbi:PKD repeat protein [Filimonas zeae]|uniref:PKD domain-containing protein n=1 Tax=Filimonas zeae TaxID=1737353 RepID=A0A917IZI5_9BACT|nr:PKD domain-containing protein [Filimonas zeae]MDR6338504.1 PKD repeat protein [Filimonas zeae]GGH67946.1 hypothetical protein GCM10011379_23730 [Filimonas zeae]
MRNKYTAGIILLALLVCFVVAACTKEEVRVLQQPDACFEVKTITPNRGFLNISTTGFIDSNFYFFNCIDTVKNVSWHWSFGDGTVSDTKNPVHSYSKRGSYTVTLVVTGDNLHDTAVQTVWVVLGEETITLPGVKSISALAMEETESKEWQVLATAGYGKENYLIRLDSLLNVTGQHALPSQYVLNAMAYAKDDNYMFTGTTVAAERYNELLKMKADGTVLWKKVYSTDESLTYVTQTTDGGYGVTGAYAQRSGSYTEMYTLIKKTDSEGNVQWQKLLDKEKMVLARDAVFEQDGSVVVAGVQRDGQDSLLIVKMKAGGEIVWRSTVYWGLNSINLSNVRILRMGNGNYAVINQNARGIYFFSPQGVFFNRILAPSRIVQLSNAADGELIVLQEEGGNGFRMMVNKLTLDGEVRWTIYPDGNQKTQYGVSCCASSWPVLVQPLRNGGTISAASMVNMNDYTYSIRLIGFDDSGRLK